MPIYAPPLVSASRRDSGSRQQATLDVANAAASGKTTPDSSQNHVAFKLRDLGIAPQTCRPTAADGATSLAQRDSYRVVDAADRSERATETLATELIGSAAGIASAMRADPSSAREWIGPPRVSAPQHSTPVGRELDARLRAEQHGGDSLPSGVRAMFAPQLGHSLKNIRIHSDATADRLSRDLGARAFSLGSHIYFKRGEFAPTTRRGGQLLAHELIHATQDSDAGRFVHRTPEEALALANQLAGGGSAPHSSQGEHKDAPPPSQKYTELKGVFRDWFKFSIEQRTRLAQAYLRSDGQTSSSGTISDQRNLVGEILVYSNVHGPTFVRAIDLLHHPEKLDQGSFGICGPIAILYNIIQNRPFLFLELMHQLALDKEFFDEQSDVYDKNPSFMLTSLLEATNQVKESGNQVSNRLSSALELEESNVRMHKLDFILAHFVMKQGRGRGAPVTPYLQGYSREKGHYPLDLPELKAITNHSEEKDNMELFEINYNDWNEGAFNRIVNKSNNTSTSIIVSLWPDGSAQLVDKNLKNEEKTAQGGHICIIKSMNFVDYQDLTSEEKAQFDNNTIDYYDIVFWSWGREIKKRWCPHQLKSYIRYMAVMPLRSLPAKG